MRLYLERISTSGGERQGNEPAGDLGVAVEGGHGQLSVHVPHQLQLPNLMDFKLDQRANNVCVIDHRESQWTGKNRIPDAELAQEQIKGRLIKGKMLRLSPGCVHGVGNIGSPMSKWSFTSGEGTPDFRALRFKALAVAPRPSRA